MNIWKRWTAAALTLSLVVSLSIAGALALSPAAPFADFRIDAARMEAPDRALEIELYQQDKDGAFLHTDTRSEDCKINQVTGDATLYIQPNVEGVWVTVDYLTNLNGDDSYELLEGGNEPVWDSLTATGELVRGGNEALDVGQTYILSAEALSARFDKMEKSHGRLLGMENPVTSWPLCRVALSRTDPADGQTYEQLYYLEIFGSELVPWDVLRSAPYCEAVEYGLTRGWFTGMDDGSFGPDQPLNRAQLALVLWRVGGCQSAEQASFTDAKSGDWYYSAVCWCQQEGLIAGYADGSFLPDGPLTREQLASILQRYAKTDVPAAYVTGDLSQYDDCGEISSWAYDSMRWAVANRILVPSGGNSLRPGSSVTRAELAEALYALRGTQPLRSMVSMW